MSDKHDFITLLQMHGAHKPKFMTFFTLKKGAILEKQRQIVCVCVPSILCSYTYLQINLCKPCLLCTIVYNYWSAKWKGKSACNAIDTVACGVIIHCSTAGTSMTSLV